MKSFLVAATITLAISTNAAAAIKPADAARLTAASRVVQSMASAVPTGLWHQARCVVVIPDLTKTSFVIGGEFGNGIMSCRVGDGWGPPVFMQLAKGSLGLQLGAETVDLLMLVMDEQGIQKLLANKVTLGVDASIAAGPVGLRADVGTDADLKAEILAYSRAQGLFAGINLSGGVLRPDDTTNHAAYGPTASPRTILASRAISAPTEASALLAALNAATHNASDRPVKGSGATAQSTPPQPATTVTPIVDSDLRTRAVAMQQMLDRLLSDGSTAAVGTGGTSASTVVVDRAKLMQLRAELDALIASLDRR